MSFSPDCSMLLIDHIRSECEAYSVKFNENWLNYDYGCISFAAQSVFKNQYEYGLCIDLDYCSLEDSIDVYVIVEREETRVELYVHSLEVLSTLIRNHSAYRDTALSKDLVTDKFTLLL